MAPFLNADLLELWFGIPTKPAKGPYLTHRSAWFAAWRQPTEPRFFAALLEVLSAVGQQAAGDALDVARFGDCRVYRVVRALAAALQQLDVAVQVAGAGKQDVL